MIRPLYRWKSFWLGLFVLVFVGWAYVDSFRFHAMACQTAGGRTMVVYRSYGVTRFGEGPTSGFSYNPEWDFTYDDRDSPFPNWVRKPDVPLFEVRDSLVFFSFLGLWGSGLTWRWRCLKRLEIKGSS